jgi:hypothetical protein
MHEAVHALGNLLDKRFGGTLKLTHILESDCFPSISSHLGTLGM